MLCLTRDRKNDSVVLILPDKTEIRIVVEALDRGRSRLLFDAPRDITILRTELLPERKDICDG